MLTEAVILAARSEMERTGWVKAESPCETTIVRYCPTRRPFDALNLGFCEGDALTKAGVWRDDSLAHPFHAAKEYDPEGVDRIVILLRRRFPDIATVNVRKTSKKESKPVPTVPTIKTEPKKLPESESRLPQINGKPVSWSEFYKLYPDLNPSHAKARSGS